MLLNDFDYSLPEELIAQEPIEKRDESRLLVVNRREKTIQHRGFRDLTEYLRDDDLMVFNNTRVTAVRLHGNKESGGQVEVLLMKSISPGVWEAMVRPGRRVSDGARLVFDEGLVAESVGRDGAGIRTLRFEGGASDDKIIRRIGEVPLPPYIHRRLDDPERYQTVYAAAGGSTAAPTAGLHFTPGFLSCLESRGIKKAFVTLDVGIATFRPVRTEKIEDHEMHTESYEIDEENAERINSTGGRIVCVGTTTARALESAAVEKHRVRSGNFNTALFIKPPYDFKMVDCLVTNFHTPKSTLLIMISALAGTELIKRAYREAIDNRYRFLSFGDAMFIC